jgi:hypothetical protein
MSDIVTLYVLDKFKKKLADLENTVREAGPEGPTGPKGDKGDKGDKGAQGPQGPRGADGAKGADGEQGPEGPEGKRGICVTDAYLSADGDIVFVLDDGTEVPVEMPLVSTEDGQVVLYSQTGGGGGGGGGGGSDADLDRYVLRPTDDQGGQWQVYRETPEGTREWTAVTTDLVSTNPDITFRDAKTGRFAKWPEDMEGLTDQLKVNRWFYDKVVDLQNALVDFGFTEVPNGFRMLKHDPDLLTHGGPVDPNELLILNINIDDCVGDVCQKLVFVAPEGKELISHYEETQQEAIFKIVQINDEGEIIRQTMRGKNGGVMNGDVYSIECDEIYGDTLIDGKECEILVRTSAAITGEWVENNFVHRKGGDSMEGPLVIQAQDVTDARATKRVITYGVFSNSDGSALRLGTTRDRVYIGHDDTSFNGPIKVDEIQEKNAGHGVEFQDYIKFLPGMGKIIDLQPADGNSHLIEMFDSNNTQNTTVDIKLLGNSYKNALRFFGRSSGSSQIAQISSDGGINLYTTLDMNQNKVTDVADATLNTDAVNLRTLNSAISALPPPADLTGIEARLDGHDEDIAEINQKLEDIRDQSAICEMVYRAGLVYPQTDGDLTSHRSDGSATGTLSAIRFFLVDEKDYSGANVPWDQLGSGQLELKGGDSSYFFTLDSVAAEASGTTWRLNVSGGYSTDGQDFSGGEQLLVFAPVSGTRSITTATLPLEHPQDPPENVRDYTTGWATQADANESFTKSILETVDALNFWSGDLRDYAKETDARLDALEASGGGGLPDGDIDLNNHHLKNVNQIYLSEDGYGTILYGTQPKIVIDDRVYIKKPTNLDNKGFEIDGRTEQGAHKPLLWAYHRSSGVDEVHYAGRTNDNTHIATVGFVREQLSGGVEAGVTHTMMGKGSWGKSIDELATDKFIAFDYQGRTRNVLDQYVMGIAVAGRFGNEFTEGLEWAEGAYVEVFASDGKLLFAKEIDSIEHDDKGYLRLNWEWMPTMYASSGAISYGTPLMLLITGLTGEVRQSRQSPLAPPENDPYIGD